MACLIFRSSRFAHILQNFSSNQFYSIVIRNANYSTSKLNYNKLKCGLAPVSGIPVYKFFSTDKSAIPPSTEPLEDPEDQEKRTKAWRRLKLSLIIMGSCFTFAGSYAFYELGKPMKDANGNIILDQFTSMPLLKQHFERFCYNVLYYKKVIQEPSHPQLLPDPVSYPYIQPPYTLVIELTDLLVHPDWTYKTGWRFKKRPHIDHFLEQVAPPLFEVVVFTAEQGFTAQPIIHQLNKNGSIVYTLFRDSTDFIDGHHVKNLDWLNRDLSKVIVLDWNQDSIKLHRENAFVISRWKGNDDDQTLIDLASFLRAIAFNKVEDVREVLSYYRQFDDPIEAFRENQRKLLEQMEEQERLEQAKKQHPPLTQRFSKSYVSFKK